jgi:hypothetical protein
MESENFVAMLISASARYAMPFAQLRDESTITTKRSR